MRRCVFLAVLLSLVLSLSKAETSETTSGPPPTTTPGTTAETSETTSGPPLTTTPGTTAETSETTSGPPPTTTPGTTAETIETTSGPPLTTTPGTTDITETTSGPPPTTTPGTTVSVELCNPDPCGKKLATCVPLNSTYTCLCQYGFYYSNEDCHKGKIYPGSIILEVLYSNSVQNVNSVQYEEMFQNITSFFKDAFNDLSGFGQTVIVKIQPLKENRAAPSTNVTVINLFMENSTVNKDIVSSAISNAIKDSSYVSLYRATTYCAAFNCDDQTTDCTEHMFPKCECKNGFEKTEWDDRSCSDCSKDCSAAENKYCAKEKGVPICKCMSNFEKKNEKCVACSVGYAGENCENNRELILIIVGTVFGAIILSLVIAVSVVSVRAKHKHDPEKKSLIKPGYSNPNTSDDRQTTMFPRVQTTSGHANPGYQPNNPYEMRSANRGRFPERDYDDLYEISREPEGFRMQSRY
ncbi:mucin-13 isoform X3 [Tyto alba]|uniref:mucin-13 isoform X3 n=1 Tax=Tyto alba TaxID=56313 RepID=UPI001C67246D|nr:mucin-13 isoform X3 [Tyto alba]